MRKLFKDTKGAVTVFVTLLLIPAILVSGTAVDLARIHSARSVLQDANQLAANSVLTQYNALLYDIYGLFGVANDDPILGKLLDDYIKVSVFGEPVQDQSLGTFQLFYGSDILLEDPMFASNMDLGNADVLRRQIEEYMKFRGPVIIVKEILEALENNKLKEDKEVIEDKTAIDRDVAELHDKYKELYNAIITADKCILPIGGISGGHFGTVSSHLKLIREQFISLKECYIEWENVKFPEAPADVEDLAAWEASAREEYERAKNDLSAKYTAILNNIQALTIGGARGSNWSDGRWRTYGSGVTGLNSHVDGAKEKGEEFKENFDAVLNISREVDAMHGELSRKVDELERKLNSGECSEELRIGLTEKHGSPPRSLIECYRDILRWDSVTTMGDAYRNGGYDYIDNKFKPMLDGVEYRNSANLSAGSLSRTELASISSNSGFALSEGVSGSSSRAALFAAFPENNVGYSMPPGFLKFAEHPGENRAFFEALTAMVNQPPLSPVKLYEGQEDAEGEDAEKKQRNMISALLELVDSAFTGLSNSPLGAMKISDAETEEPERLGILDIVSLIPKAFSDPVIGIIEDPIGSMGRTGDYVLLLTYCTSMFSNYTTTRPESLGKTRDDLSGIDFPKSISGVPISPEVNYFFQSEWEYMYHGSQNAGTNLSAVTRLLFLVRLICNYIRVFSVSEISTIVTGIKTAFAWCPPLGLVLGELARAAFAAAETLIDIASLRSGHKVPLFKNVSAGEWVCSPTGVLNAIKNVIADGASSDTETSKEKGLTYSNYMLFFFIAKGIFYFGRESDVATELTIRAGDLIEWNMINYEKKVNADEGKMAEALTDSGRFKLSDMSTGFSITTTATIHMLFLSMPLAQRGIDGVIPPETMPITVTDYRGY